MLKNFVYILLLVHVYAYDVDELIQQQLEEDFSQGEQGDKRIIMPGTLWCGNGNKADSEDDLGSFTEVDMCCREHDHCPRTVGAFKKQYGFRNLFLFTVSDCKCDFMFYTCLKNVEDHKVAAKLVGKMFFNVLRMPCLRFNREGTEAFKTHSRRFK
ncbi:acidic phospholipase A2 PA4-like [Rhopilema esculentum]|uniref:acidic phospholipase A2 PA4-like n=1 Tax=Rhopilema esculentum TaxID=499914 RepID=UPI0031D27A40